MRITTAMILAAGRGERMRPYTDTTPKPLLQVGKYKLIEYHLYALAVAGFRRIIVNLNHLGQQIQDCLGDGSSYGVDILYSWEFTGALETAGGIRHALPLLNAEQFLVINGDVFCDIPYGTLQLRGDAAMHLVMVPNPEHHPDGDFLLAADHQPALLKEKHPDFLSTTFSGVGLYRHSVFSKLPDSIRTLAPVIRHYIAKNAVTATLYNGQWIDVGTPARLDQVRNLAPKLDSNSDHPSGCLY